MAKKRKQKEPEEEEEIEIKLPEFDDEAFLKEETRSAKVTFIAVGYGALCGILTFILFWILGDNWQVSVAVGLVLMVGIVGFLTLFKIDIKELNWKNWVGAVLTYTASWLIVFIILNNVPFYDRQAPDIRINQIYTWDDVEGEFEERNMSAELDPADENYIVAVVTDNSDVDSVELKVWFTEDGSQLPSTVFIKTPTNKFNFSESKYVKYHGHIYEFRIPATLADGPYNYEIMATDDNDHEAKDTGKFYIRRG